MMMKYEVLVAITGKKIFITIEKPFILIRVFVSEWIPPQLAEFLPILVTTSKIISSAIQNHVISQSYPLNSCTTILCRPE
jgi:hypothetical protein